MLDESLDQFVLLAELLHEVLEELMGRCAWLSWIKHIQYSGICSVIHQEIFPLGLMVHFS